MQIMADICEKGDAARPLLLQLLLALVRAERISPIHLHKEVALYLELVEDFVIDVPKIYDILGGVVSTLIKQGILQYPWFQAEARRALPAEKEEAFIK
jgi:hypothetical protein